YYENKKSDEHMITSFHASNFLSSFYRIYVPVLILSLIVQFITLLFYIFVWNYQLISPYFKFHIIIQGVFTGLGIIVLSDHEMRQRNLTYSPRGKTTSVKRGILYSFPLIGLYFGFKWLIKILIVRIGGLKLLFPSEGNYFRIEQPLIDTSRDWLFLTKNEKALVFIGFILVFIGIEMLLRGLIANDARSYNLGGAGIVFIPAVVQAFAFNSGSLIFSDPVYYFYSLFDDFLVGVVIGIVYWRTRNFNVSIIVSFLIRILDNSLDFHTTVMNSLPESFGLYDPLDSTLTTADQIANSVIYIQIILALTAPFLIIVFYEESWAVITELYSGLRKQWFGLLILGVAFLLIDIIFSFVWGLSQFMAFLLFILALFVIGIVISILFKVLPTPQQPILRNVLDRNYIDEYPIDIKSDIKWIEHEESWIEKPRIVSFVAGFSFLYLLFIAGFYRQFKLLFAFDLFKYVVFLILLPTIIISVFSYFLSNSYHRGYFFFDNYRRSMYILLGVILGLNFYLWTQSTTTVNFNWRYVPLAVPVVILIWPKPLRKPLREFSYGLAKDGRYSTFRWVKNKKSETFTTEFNELINHRSETVKLGAWIIANQLKLFSEEDLLSKLDRSLSKGDKTGIILGLGMNGSKLSERKVLDMLKDDDLDVKICCYWSLGNIGSSKSLNRMVRIMEENPYKDLITMAEKSILKIDPSYPLAGIRQSVTVYN
ncbi:MAG: hypothetical protein OEZ01_15655, partial [Candidatus Heimdallarchaeota archaeon]|nr:hypothetical protein [Candidatus Heimdallarchaeota archaeon]